MSPEVARRGPRRYTLTVEEFLSWQYSIDRHGLTGWRTTRIHEADRLPTPTGRMTTDFQGARSDVFDEAIAQSRL